ncbi:MAG: sugar nucleotide-binding protein, partial [Flavisolibacter sp.]
RTSAFFGPWDEYNFVHYVRQNLEQYRSIKVARDIYISPTYVPDLVHATLDLMIDKERGIWHLANKGITTWADLAWKIADRFDLDRSLIERVDAQGMSYAATRPAYSILGSEKGWLLPSFEQAFNRYVTEVNKEKRKVA